MRVCLKRGVGLGLGLSLGAAIGLLAVAAMPARAQGLDASRVPFVTIAPGVRMKELTGLAAPLRSARQSVALFRLDAGHGNPSSHNATSEEIFVIVAGRGVVWLDGTPHPVSAGDVVRIAPRVRHRAMAGQGDALCFYAISAPPFRPDDYHLDAGPQESGH